MVLKYFDTETNLGIYSFVNKYVISFSFIISIFSSYILSGLQKNNKNNDYLIHSFIISFYLLFVFVFILLIITQFIFQSFFFEYLAGLNLFYILLPSLFFYLTGYIFTYALILSEKSKYILFNSIFGLLVNSILNLILIPEIGYYGAGISTLFSTFISGFFIMLFYFESRQLAIKLLSAIISPKTIISSFNKFYENNRL